MRSLKKSVSDTSIEELYALKIKSFWRALKKEHFSFLFLCAYYLFEYVRPQALYPVIDILPWAQLFLILTLVSLFSDKSITGVKHPLNKLFILFILVVFLSSIAAYYPSISWKFRNIMLSWLLVYFLTIHIVNTEKRFFLFLVLYLLFSLKMGQHGFFDWMRRGFSFAGYGLIGSPGWFRNSGEFAIQMLIFGSLALAFVATLKGYWGKYKKYILYAAAATGYICVVGASSRGSQIGLAIIFILFSLKIKNGFKGLIGISILGYLLYSILPDEQMSRFVDMGEDMSSLQRLEYWKIGFTLIEEHPILGIGYKNWVAVITDIYPAGVPPLNIVEVSHSIYIEAAAELGLLGLFLFILMALFAFIANAKTRKTLCQHNDKLLYNISYALDAGLIGYLVAGAFVTVLTYPFFWIQLAMIVTLNNVASKINIKKELKEVKSLKN